MKKIFLIILFGIGVLIPAFANAKSFTGLIIQWNKAIPENAVFQIRVFEKNKWSEWYEEKDDLDRDEGNRVSKGNSVTAVSDKPETLFLTNEATNYEYRWIPKNCLDKDCFGPDPAMAGYPKVKITPINVGRKRVMTSRLLTSIDIPNTVRIIKREEWGANENWLYELENRAENGGDGSIGQAETIENPEEFTQADPEIERVVEQNSFGMPYTWPVQYAKQIKFIVIHHTASVKNLDNPEVAIQNIYYYHAVRRGWGDIGYNYLIDPNGNIFEGRQGKDKVIGGHVKSLNKVSVGIGVLGNYEDGEIPVPVLRALLALTNFLARKYNIDPAGSAEYKGNIYQNINGHKDINATICPGKFLYQKLFGIRALAAEDKNPKRNISFEDIENDIIVIPPDAEKTFRIKIKNKTANTWNSLTQLRIAPASSLLDEIVFTSKQDDPYLVAEIRNFPAGPNEIAEFEGKIKTSLASTFAVYNVMVAQNGSLLKNESFTLPVFIEGIELNYEVISRHDPKNLMMPLETAKGWIELKNTGNFTWRNYGENAVYIVSKRTKSRIGKLLQTEIKPNEIGRFLLTFKAPQEPGVYEESLVPFMQNNQYFPDQNIIFKFEVRKNLDEKPIRIKLGFEKLPIITSRTVFSLFDGEKFVKTFPKNSYIRVFRILNGTWRVIWKENIFILKDGPRFMAHFNGLMVISNWQRRPSWNKFINDNVFRGTIEITKIDGKITLINELPLEDYLKGVAEVTNDTPYEKIKALTILARTYAKFYMTKARKFPGKPYDLDDNPSVTQKYLGANFEKRAPNIKRAVEETEGEIVKYQGSLIKTPYFSQSDGRTRSAEEIWGWKDTPYLKSVPDPYCEGKELKGHGVGLSGCGAEGMAKIGKTAEEIIKYYYQGVEITREN